MLKSTQKLLVLEKKAIKLEKELTSVMVSLYKENHSFGKKVNRKLLDLGLCIMRNL
jgi:hypothetical protein